MASLRNRRISVCYRVMLLLAVPMLAATSQSTTSGTITGVVLSAADSLPVPSAMVTLDSSAAQVTTDSTGAFVLTRVPFGAHAVIARRLGFAPTGENITVASTGTTKLVLRLVPTIPMLAQVVVRGVQVSDLPRFVQAVERARRSNGAVFTAAEIDRDDPLDTKELLGQLPGVHVDDRGIAFDRCQDDGTLASGTIRSGGAYRSPSAEDGPSTGSSGPRVQVYVDGVRLTHDETRNSGDARDRDDASGILRGIDPRSIAVMEVYTGIAKIPAEYLADACAVIAIWTKAN